MIRKKAYASHFLSVIMMVLLFPSCFKAEPRREENPEPVQKAAMDTEVVLNDQIQNMLEKAEIPPELARRILAAAVEGPTFILDLLMILEGDPYLRILVDKKHPLPPDYAPEDLVELTESSYRVSRPGLLLRQAAAESLEEMAAAAGAEGITLIVSSTYRSYAYQEGIYQRNVQELGQETADRESARPGYSQHQTGSVVDFGSITDSFAETPAGRWLLVNGSRFGWSLSFPDGYEAVTGYRWESWHYRYLGRELCAFIDTYFDGIQQYALRFINEWEQHR
ncbi:M15 family metallopeptidase [Treponema sp. TIM-1]|uniref:M15 family metallopeptidase n=1 Tax=Treponema sp. TIM-1 TaxID=2898417 RepID=UPI00397F6435